MKISDMYKEKNTVVSFEVFPAKPTDPIQSVYRTVGMLASYEPDFISVTYGAGGTNSKNTIELAQKIKNDFCIESLVHLTNVGMENENASDIATRIKNAGLENVLALRGDMPKDATPEQIEKLRLKYAKDLILRLREESADLSIGAACYPEGHPETINRYRGIDYLKEKVDAGADFLITQLFFDNNQFYDFLNNARRAGIDVPISAGVMPCLNAKQINRMRKLSGCTIPDKFRRILDRFEDSPEALKEAGEAYALDQVIDLLAWGVDGIHLYTMNRPDTCIRIMDEAKKVLKLKR